MPGLLKRIVACRTRHRWGCLFQGVPVALLVAGFSGLRVYAGEATASSPKTTVNVVHAPAKSLVPDVVMDSKGVLHMVYGLERNGYYIRSADNGATFGPSEKVNLTNLSGLACSMCMMRARTGADGNVYLAFRSAEGSIRDFYVLTSRATENRFTALRVNEDNWNIDYCPMCGPELTFAPSGQSLCAFMTRKKVYWAISDSASPGYRLHASTPASEEDEIYPSAIANRQGDVLFVWQVGPMAVEGTALVKWARYDTQGKPTGEAGMVGTSFAGTKATAFVGNDDNFYIVSTATREAGAR